MELPQRGERQPAARLAIGARAAVERLVLRRIPDLDFTHDFAAGTTRTQDLAQKGPERQGLRIEALAAVDALGRGG